MKRSKIEELKNNPLSKPMENWDIQECIFKRWNIRTLEEANSILFDMENISDTEKEVDENFQSQGRPKRKKFSPKNLVLKKLFERSKNHSTKRSLDQHNSTLQDLQDILNLNTSQNTFGNSFKVVDDSFVLIPENEALNSESFHNLVENQKKIYCVLEKLSNSISGLHAKLDKLVDKNFKQPSFVTPLPIDHSKMKPIDTKDECSDMEEKLCNESYKNAWITALKTLFVDKGQYLNKGYDCCFLVIDKIFTRKFLTLCSWSGASRNESPKIALKSYKNILDLMFFIISIADPNFTYEILITFMKIQLRNSKRRAEIKENSRQSIQKEGQN